MGAARWERSGLSGPPLRRALVVAGAVAVATAAAGAPVARAALDSPHALPASPAAGRGAPAAGSRTAVPATATTPRRMIPNVACPTVPVPLDRTAGTPATVPLAVAIEPSHPPMTGTAPLHSPPPGQPARPR